MSTKYKEIYNDIKSQIEEGMLSPNQKIQDEITLSKKYKCSRMTIKKALDILVQEGLLFRKRGMGSFVMSSADSKHKLILSERELTGLTKQLSNTSVTSKILDFRLIFADEKIAKYLNMKANDPLYSIWRLRFVKDMPYVLEKTYMNPSIIPGITPDILNQSIYNYIEQDLGLRIGAAKKNLRACPSNEEDQKYLGLHNNEPVLEVEQIAYLDNGIPFEYSFSRHRYDKFEFTTYSLRI